ncbi:serine/threonine protein kinase [Streptomyces californicus]|uniref:non-specific serine/threonine protein kinase n=2 Tax=Streptomyces TaxID=1883 RepID=A0ABD7D0Y8_9ACTN|nr:MULTISPECIES: serine/threonine-protein kinase [Streptomyces]QRV29659.1 serine/threonine protein kinase [Streptomyces californicus]QRV34733.1 serine/threonine protein kinase [Streptomyces californicus]QRV43074.1 serine/threonine protein kinase [Streptomyces californicus]QRV49761.1 serine/threonine protein kinase [Streptomyces californicus]
MDRSHGTDAGLVLAGRYRLGDVLGRGGMGKVWRAHDEVLHRTVAVKELTAGLYVAEADRLVLHARTQKEARAAARITHPGVVTVHDVIEYDQRPWIVMQYVDGPSLADAAKESGEIAPREAARIGLHVLSALRAAHSAGVLHRDVKPGNVLLARDGQVLLTDFGIAAIEGDSTITRTGELVGSIDYLAPERVRGGDPGPASDLWSLGATLYTAVEGTSPFRRTSPISTMQAVVTDEPPAPVNAGPLGPVITALLRKDPDDRPTAAQTEQMLLDAMEGREPRAAQAHVPTQRYPEESRYGYRDPRGADAPADPPGSDGSTARLPGAADPAAERTAPDQPAPAPAHPVTGPASAPVTRRSGSRWRTVLAVVVAAAVLGGAAGLVAMKYGEGSDTPGGTGGGTAASSPQATPGTTPEATDPAQGVPDVPDGWQRVEDPAGFSLVVPDGWRRQVQDGQIDYTPDGGAHRIRVSVDPDPDFDHPFLHMESMEEQLSERLPGYRRIGLEKNTFRDRPGALWEFTWNETKDHAGLRHGIDQMYYGGPGGPEYALYLTAPEDGWAESREKFDIMLRSWRAPKAQR